jgi:hypothetical protein
MIRNVIRFAVILLFFYNPVEAQRVVITFGSTPSTPSSLAFAPIKYDKDMAYSLTFDDSQADAYTVGLPFLGGGYVALNKTNYPGFFFTDGCGNNVPFRGGIAWNTANVLGTDVHVGNAPSNLSWQQLDTLYALNWDVFNHSFDHKSALESVLTDQDYRDEIDKNAVTMRERTHKNIETPVFVIPSGDTKYAPFAFEKGYKAVFNQAGDVIGIGGLKADDSIAFNKVIFRSIINESVNQINPFDDAIQKCVNGAHYWFNEFNHRVDDITGTNKELQFYTFESHLKYIAGRYGKNGTDQIWMAPLQEVTEYFYMRRTLKYTVSYDQNKMIIDFDMANVPTWFRRNNMTLKINGDADISTVTVQRGLNFTVRPKGKNKIINLDFGNVRTVIPTDFPVSDTAHLFASTCFPDSVGTFIKKFTNRFGLDSIVFTTVTYQSPASLPVTRAGNILSAADSKKYQWFKNDTLVPNATQKTFTITATGTYRVVSVDVSGCTVQSQVLFARYFDCFSAQKNIGDACDDGDFNTVNDKVRANCTCRGDSVPNKIVLKCPSDTLVSIKIGNTNAFVNWETPFAVSQCLADSSVCLQSALSGFRYVGRVGKSFYYLSNDLKMWGDAQNISAQNGGRLAVIKNETINTFLTSVIKTTDAVFIGLSNAAAKNVFKWTDGTGTTGFTNWDTNEPNTQNNFAVLTGWSGGKWATVNSSVAHYFILEIECTNYSDNALTQTAGGISGSNFPLGTHTVSYSATNKCGNKMDCRFNVTVDYSKINPSYFNQVSGNKINALPKFLTGSANTINGSTQPVNYTVYPNPSNGIFKIKPFGEINSESEWVISNSVGSVILRKKYFLKLNDTEIQVNLSNYPDGIYFLNLVAGDAGINVFRLIKNVQ